MKPNDQRSSVMRVATKAASRTENWSPAKQAFAIKVTAGASSVLVHSDSRTKSVSAASSSSDKKTK